MGLEFDFHGAELSEITAQPDQVILFFSQILIVEVHPSKGVLPGQDQWASATLSLKKPKYKSLPKKGKIIEAELYGIPGKALNGRLTIDFKFKGDCELVLELLKSEYSIHAQALDISLTPS
ncbi:MAG: hypothetical protein NTX25_01915 [Proteobacteria bacterium]|nr:hypothetical protein [Pseudomonadota bacterium]